MCLTIAYSKIKKQNLVLINNDTYQRETLSERPIRQPLKLMDDVSCIFAVNVTKLLPTLELAKHRTKVIWLMQGK